MELNLAFQMILELKYGAKNSIIHASTLNNSLRTLSK